MIDEKTQSSNTLTQSSNTLTQSSNTLTQSSNTLTQSGNTLTQSGNLIQNGLFPSTDLLPSAEPLPTGIREGNAGLLSLRDLEAQIGDGSDGFYGRLRRFADVPGIGELLGAVNVPGAKGVRYEPRSAEIFRRLLTASTAKEVTPATAVAWLKTHQEATPSQSVQPGEDGQMVKNGSRSIAEKTQSSNTLTQFSNLSTLPSNSMTLQHGEDAQLKHGEDAQLNFATRLLSGILAPITAVLTDLASEIKAMREGRKALTDQPVSAPAPPPDRLLTAEDAAALLACKPRSVGRHVLPVSQSPRRYRESDVLRHIAGLTPITRETSNKETSKNEPSK